MSTQSMEAVKYANKVRLGIAGFRRELGELRSSEAAERLAQAIDDDHDSNVPGGSRIAFLLTAVPGIGSYKASRCLQAAGVNNGDRKLRDLTPRQRDAVAWQLRFWAETRP